MSLSDDLRNEIVLEEISHVH